MMGSSQEEYSSRMARVTCACACERARACVCVWVCVCVCVCVCVKSTLLTVMGSSQEEYTAYAWHE